MKTFPIGTYLLEVSKASGKWGVVQVDVATGEHIPCNPVYNMLIVVNGTLYQRIHHRMNGGKTYANTDSFAYSEISEEEVTVMKLSGQ